MTHLYELYQKNYTAWAEKTAELLKAGKFSELDTEHLLEELASMGASEYNELESRLTILIAHLLKWQFQYQQLSDKWREFDGRSWRSTIPTCPSKITCSWTSLSPVLGMSSVLRFS